MAFGRLQDLSETLPPQHSPEWYATRMKSANASEYGRYEGYYQPRSECLLETCQQIRGTLSKPANLLMSFGTTFEEISGYLFTQVTGFSYYAIGSLGHPLNDRIRGSLDGYGLDHLNRLFVLETKSHASQNTFPGPSIGNPNYAKQVVQNIEIADADYALFNSTRLIPCTSDDVRDSMCGHSMIGGRLEVCRFSRYNLADPSTMAVWKGETPLPSIHLIAISVSIRKSLLPRNEITSIGNPFDALTRRHPWMTQEMLEQYIISGSIRWKAFDHTHLIGPSEALDEWIEKCELAKKNVDDHPPEVARVADRQDDDCVCGVAYMKVSSHNIQAVPRQKEYWETYLRPVSEAWIRDLDDALDGRGREEREQIAYPDPIGT